MVEVDRSPGGGELSPFPYPGTGNRPPNKKKKKLNPRGYVRGRMVTGGIELRIRCLLMSHHRFVS